ncbi:MAG: hypothetical protein R3F29_00295 [Planctomycetota bacterium]
MAKRQSKTQRATGPAEKPATLATRLRDYIEQLDWSERQLAEAAGVSRPRVAACMGRAVGAERGSRHVTKADVNRIAVALALAFEEAGTAGLGTAHIDSLLNELLDLAGFAASTGRHPDSIVDHWQQGRALRLGYFPWGQFMQAGFDGLAALIAEQARVFLGIGAITPVPLALGELDQAIRDRQVDLVGPLLGIASREATMALSDPVPHLAVGINAIIRASDLPVVAPSIEGSHPRPDEVNWNRVNLHYVRGGVPETLKEILTGNVMGGSAVGMNPLDHDTFAEAVEAALGAPSPAESSDQRRVDCLVADDITCQHVAASPKYRDARLLFHHAPGTPGRAVLPVVFAAHRDERGLIRLLNRCIAHMEDSGFFEKHLRDVPFPEVVQWDRWLPRDQQFSTILERIDQIQRHLDIPTTRPDSPATDQESGVAGSDQD